MAVIKCKMCGGSLNISEDSSVCECEYCGTKQTVPKADDEKKLKLFDRAGRLLRGCEFDKAAGVFESIVEDFPEEAEAYWGLVLCKYGIEYVDDPATGKKVPTCHRSSFDNVMKDPNFEQACENADAIARRVYRDEARAIEELRRGILEVSGKEEPYDIFISYKEKDENGERTPDSVIAQDIYRELTREGYRVFFSRISLENRLGTEYEPYIFAALNSARVMLVVGTDYENFDAVWVKNEWSRYLKLIAKGEKKTLIPVFRDMDAYDMPEAFNNITALDMGKLGALQDLVHGVEKIVGKKKAEPAAPVQQPMYVSNEADAKTAAAVKRGRLALEEGNWGRATEYFEQALTLDAECAEAYFGMALAEAECPSAEELSRRICSQTPEQKTLYIPKAVEHIRDIVKQYRVPRFLDENEIEWHYRDFDLSYTSTAGGQKVLLEKEKQAFEGNRNLSLAYRFAKGTYKETVENYKRTLYGTLEANVQKAEREEQETAKEKEDKYNDFLEKADRKVEALNIKKQEEREKSYQKACQEFEEAKSSHQFKAVKAKYEFLLAYKDSEEYVQRCNNQIAVVEAEEKRERLYITCSKIFGTTVEQTVKNWEAAKAGFESLGDYKDAPALAEKCAEMITQLKAAKAEADERKQLAEKAAAEEAERQRILKEKAEKERKAKNKKIGVVVGILVAVAIVVFLVVTKVIIPAKQYKEAEALFEAGQYQEAITAFEALGGYKDAPDRADAAQTALVEEQNAAAYAQAEALLEAEDYDGAIAAFTALGSYRDSADRASAALEGKNAAAYADAEALEAAGQVQEAAFLYGKAAGYSDARERSFALWEEIAQRETVSAGQDHTVGLRSDGTVVATGAKGMGQCDVSGWRNVVAVSAGGTHTVGLRADGTVVATGWNKYGQCDVSDWENVVAVSAGSSHTVGLRADGTVVATGQSSYGQCNVGDWTDIVAVSAGERYTVGLRADGTVLAVGSNGSGECEVSGWTDMVAVSAGDNHTVGLRSDGTVVATGANGNGQCDVSGWRNVVAVSAGVFHTVGLRSDGTVVAAGYNGASECNVSGWQDVVAISAGQQYTVALRADGTVVATGYNGYGRCDVIDWKDIKLPN